MDLRKSQKDYQTILMFQELLREEEVEPPTWVVTDLCTMLPTEVYPDMASVQMILHHEIHQLIRHNSIIIMIFKNNLLSVVMLLKTRRANSDSHFREQFRILRSVEM